MSLFRLARKNIQNYAAQRLKQFIWIATSTTICFFIVSIQSNEMIVEKLQHIPLFVALFYYVSIFLLFVCSFITYKMINSFLKTRKREFQLYEGSDMKKRTMVCLLWQEQLVIFGGAGFFGLIHGMLFLKLCTIIFMKIARIYGGCSAPITISSLLVTTLFIIILIVLSMWQCYQYIQGLKKKSSHKTEKKA
ncbi:ABC transporter permease [Bacillus pfraonensis]|uniref:ABC transporter permease n=1 Tax=Bacillus TaxID=1386 RepID=UPI002A4F0E16|nr:ABC transporter permease [Bacillus pseudomycoides]